MGNSGEFYIIRLSDENDSFVSEAKLSDRKDNHYNFAAVGNPIKALQFIECAVSETNPLLIWLREFAFPEAHFVRVKYSLQLEKVV